MKNYLFLVIIILLFNSCSDNVQPDPCAGLKPIKADFIILEELFDNVHDTMTYIPTDSVLTYKIVKFIASGNYDYYEWQLGDDTTRYYGKTLNFRFYKPWGLLNMRLVVRSKPNTECLPDEDGIDTVFKPVYIMERGEVAIQGEYHGYDISNPLDTFIVTIKWVKDTGLIITNINRGCIKPSPPKPYPVEVFYSNYIAYFNGGSAYTDVCLSPKGTAILQPDHKTIVIDYEAGKPKERVKYHFVGVK